ncbi:hypothetical protein QZH41_004107 [Actinostola sp. cb2023]|nr:hypothetical protein QZH41_004107 [Actinostola sp. cb2023]
MPLSNLFKYTVGTTERKIPYANTNPMTQAFKFVSCPNYMYEVRVCNVGLCNAATDKFIISSITSGVNSFAKSPPGSLNS